MKKLEHILVTGGLGFIGSHASLKLLEYGYEITILDSCINSSPLCISRLKLILNSELGNSIFFQKGDIRDYKFLKGVFLKAINKKKPIRAVIHFAGLKKVRESLNFPLRYWDNNVTGSITLLKVMEEFRCNNLVFSSSATVYGNSESPLNENLALNPNNPYGHTKATVENILGSIFETSKNSWRIASLRYFNPIGAHETGLIGEDPLNQSNNLFPLICRAASGERKKLKIFGDDWPTSDGTGVRDYIHVMDLAECHCRTLNYLLNNKPQSVAINIGTGKGLSVLELINAFMKVNKCEIPYEICSRRPGDVAILIANNNRANLLLDWSPKKTIEDMCRDGWRWHKLNPNGYK